jgi:hypothetical protein
LLTNAPVVASLETLATRAGLTVGHTKPFTAQVGPEDLQVPPVFTQAAFRLSAEEPFYGPIIAEDGVYVIARQQRLPSEIPALETIREKVQGDARLMQAAQLARSTGTNASAAINVALVAGKTFAAACTEAKVTSAKLPAFSLATREMPEVENHVSLGRLQEVAFGLPTGKVSTFVPTEDGGGMILHVTGRSAGDAAKAKTDAAAFLAQIRQTRQGEAFNAWFSREAERALRDIPYFQRKATAPQP